MNFRPIQVEAYSGYRVNERPIAFVLDGRRYEVADIVDRWYEGGKSPKDQQLDYFKVRTTDGQEWMLRYDHLFDVWSVRVN